jgi:hypothetical protein
MRDWKFGIRNEKELDHKSGEAGLSTKRGENRRKREKTGYIGTEREKTGRKVINTHTMLSLS